MLREGFFQASICNALSLVLLWKITGVILTWSNLTWSIPLSVKVKKQRIYDSHKWDVRTCLHILSPGTMASNGILISVQPKMGAPRSTNLETHRLNVCSPSSLHTLLHHTGPRALQVCSGPMHSAGSPNLVISSVPTSETFSSTQLPVLVVTLFVLKSTQENTETCSWRCLRESFKRNRTWRWSRG